MSLFIPESKICRVSSLIYLFFLSLHYLFFGFQLQSFNYSPKKCFVNIELAKPSKCFTFLKGILIYLDDKILLNSRQSFLPSREANIKWFLTDSEEKLEVPLHVSFSGFSELKHHYWIYLIMINFKKNFMVPFYGWGSTASRL